MKRINILTALMLSFFMLSICYAQENQNKSTGSMRNNALSTQMTREIEGIENQIIDAVKAKDINQFGKFLSDDFKGVYSNGITSKSEEIKRVQNSEQTDMKKSGENVTFPADNVAVLTYKADRKYKINGKDMSGTYNASTVLVKENGQWKVVEHTMIKEMK